MDGCTFIECRREFSDSALFVWVLFQFFGEGGGCMVEIGCGEEEPVNFIGGHISEHLN